MTGPHEAAVVNDAFNSVGLGSVKPAHPAPPLFSAALPQANRTGPSDLYFERRRLQFVAYRSMCHMIGSAWSS
jgi:hypothetical protein